jgi:hypothetical protein
MVMPHSGDKTWWLRHIVATNASDHATQRRFKLVALPQNYDIQGDSKKWTQFLTSIFPELCMVDEVLKFEIPPLERLPSAQLCSSVS